jgi:hypothetical protein
MTDGVSCTIGGRSRRPIRGYPNANGGINTGKFADREMRICGMRISELQIAKFMINPQFAIQNSCTY